MMNNNRYNKVLWVIPFLMFLFTMGMNTQTTGTDLNGQVYSLSQIEGSDPLSFLFRNTDQMSGSYYTLYVILNNAFHIRPIVYISMIAFLFYFLFIYILLSYSKKYTHTLGKNDITLIVLYSICSFSPIYICVSRFLFAINLLIISLILLYNKKYILGILLAILGENAHSGILLIILIIIVAFALRHLWLNKSNNRAIRNFIVIVTCFILLINGPLLFSIGGDFLSGSGFLSEKYDEIYLNATAGDGQYKVVIILSMLGALYVLLANCLLDKNNDLVYSIALSGLFFTCLLFNQKIFFVQRIMMIMPIFMGVTTMKICEQRRYHIGSNNVYTFSLIILPLILVAQLYFWRNTFFGV